MNNNKRPTPKEIAEARAYFERDTVRQFAAVALRDALGTVGLGHFKTLLAATEPPTDEDRLQLEGPRHDQQRETIVVSKLLQNETGEAAKLPINWHAYAAKIREKFIFYKWHALAEDVHALRDGVALRHSRLLAKREDDGATTFVLEPRS